MAEILQLQVEDTEDTTSNVDLIAGPWTVLWGGYVPNTTTVKADLDPVRYGAHPKFSHFGAVVETIELRANGSPAELAAGENAIHALLDQARRFFEDPLIEDSVWLCWSSPGEPEGEGQPKRALVYDGVFQLTQKSGADAQALHPSATARLVITRHPFWEITKAPSITDYNVTVWGDTVDLTSISDVGPVPGRILYLQLAGDAASGGPLYQWWLGIRDEYRGSSGFEPIWELEDGTNGTDTSDVADATASNGNKIQCDFAGDESLVQRSAIQVADVIGADYDHMLGRYLVLLRCKLSAGSSECGIQLQYGFENTAGFYQCEEVYVDHTSWYLVPLGQVQIPPAGFRFVMVNTAALQHFELRVFAERLSGAASLDMDALCLVPCDHLVTINKSATALASEDTRDTFIYTFPHDEGLVQIEEVDEPVCNVEFSFHDWYLPASPGVMVVAGQRETSHDMTDNVDIALTYLPRYRLFRAV